MNKFNHKSGQYIELDGTNLYFEEIGNKEKPVLLMLHGGFGNIENMNPITSYLSENFRIIGIDSRGHGKSTLGNAELTYKQIQIDVESILQHLGISTVSIVGFSDGGIVAYRIAASNKVKVTKMVTMGSSWREKDIIDAEAMISGITPESAKEIFANDYDKYQKLNPEPDFKKFTESLVTMWLDKTETGHPKGNVENIKTKTLLIRGDNDFLVSLESLVELKSKIKDAAFMNVPFAEHVVYEEQPLIIETILKTFLND